MVSPDGVAPSRIVCVSASVNLPLHHKVQKFSSGTGSPGYFRKNDHKTVVVVEFSYFETEPLGIYGTGIVHCTGQMLLLPPINSVKALMATHSTGLSPKITHGLS